MLVGWATKTRRVGGVGCTTAVPATNEVRFNLGSSLATNLRNIQAHCVTTLIALVFHLKLMIPSGGPNLTPHTLVLLVHDHMLWHANVSGW